MVKWAVELGEYDVDFEPRNAIKLQALVDFVQETTREQPEQPWVAYADGSVTRGGVGLGVYIITPQGDTMQIGVKCQGRPLSNNEAEYEAVIKALKVVTQAGATRIHVKTDSQLVAQQYAGTCNVKEKRMKAYVEDLKSKAARLEELVIEQIPREDNDRADTLARMAGAAEGTWLT